MIDPTAQSALIGLIEVRRYRAIVLRQLGRAAESEAAIASARALARANQMGVPLVSARLTRTGATTDDVRGDVLSADTGFSSARQNFTQVVPSTRPVAETALLQAGVAAKQGNIGRAVELCRAGAALLRDLRSGIDPALLEPCLAAFAAEADRRPGDRQALLAQMFETAELAQDSVTSREIDEAAARLAANARDPRVAEAIRRRQDADDRLAELYRQRDALAANAPPGSVRPGARDQPVPIWTGRSSRRRPSWPMPMAHCRPRRPITASWCSRWCRRPTCWRRSVRTRRWPRSRSRRMAAGASCCAAGAIDAAPSQGRCSLDHCAGQAGAGEHRIALRDAAEVRHGSGAGAVRRDARAGGSAARRREGAGGRAVRGAAVAAVRGCC